MIIEARLGIAAVFAKAQHDAELIRLDAEEARKAPHHDRGKRDQQDTASAEIAAGQHAFELVLAAAQQLFQIRRRWAGRLRPRAPGALGASRAPWSAALIAPWHRNLSCPANV